MIRHTDGSVLSHDSDSERGPGRGSRTPAVGARSSSSQPAAVGCAVTSPHDALDGPQPTGMGSHHPSHHMIKTLNFKAWTLAPARRGTGLRGQKSACTGRSRPARASSDPIRVGRSVDRARARWTGPAIVRLAEPAMPRPALRPLSKSCRRDAEGSVRREWAHIIRVTIMNLRGACAPARAAAAGAARRGAVPRRETNMYCTGRCAAPPPAPGPPGPGRLPVAPIRAGAGPGAPAAGAGREGATERNGGPEGAVTAIGWVGAGGSWPEQQWV